MKYCPKCGATNADSASSCQECGSPLPDIIIPARITVHTLIPTEVSSNSSISSNITIRISRHTATAVSRCPGKTLAYSQGISFFVLFFPLSPVAFMASTG